MTQASYCGSIGFFVIPLLRVRQRRLDCSTHQRLILHSFVVLEVHLTPYFVPFVCTAPWYQLPFPDLMANIESLRNDSQNKAIGHLVPCISSLPHYFRHFEANIPSPFEQISILTHCRNKQAHHGFWRDQQHSRLACPNNRYQTLYSRDQKNRILT
jgi:hypothetical protein